MDPKLFDQSLDAPELKTTSWKIPVLLTDMKVRADHIGGEIKQADANIIAAQRRQAEVREMQRIADQAVDAAIAIAADRRAERDALAAAMHAHVLGLGEVPPTTDAPVKSNGVLDGSVFDVEVNRAPD